MKLARPHDRQPSRSACWSPSWIIFVVNDVILGQHGQRPSASTAIRSLPSPSACPPLLTALSVSVTLKYLTKPIYIVALFSAAAAAGFMEEFGVIIDMDMIRNAAQTTPSEAGHLMTPAFFRHMVFYALLPSLLIAMVRIRSPAASAPS
jgi:glucan phosphoethanolaminetransferase (alkaline phosphatase superfamily)